MRLKLTTVALFVAVALPSAAQSLLDLQPAPGVYVNGVKPEDGALHLRELVIWTEDLLTVCLKHGLLKATLNQPLGNTE